MQSIELIGCTGAGKSTLLGSLLRVCQEQGIQASNGDDFVLESAHLDWLNGYLLRTLCIDLLIIPTSIFAWRKHSDFYELIFRLIFRLKKTGWFEKLNILRNTFKKVGIHEMIQRKRSSQHIILLDEGTLHTAHYLFVHLTKEFSDVDLANFANCVPLPDTVIYLRQNEEVLVERTLARGHKRIRSGSRELTQRFIHRAVIMFEKLTEARSIASRMLIVDSEYQVQVPQGEANLAMTTTLALLNTGLARATASPSGTPMPANPIS
jgi:thymidylate kinase